ncbi:Rod shape-determining protein RodA [compost metagenome]
MITSIRKHDWILTFTLLLFSIISICAIYSATFHVAIDSPFRGIHIRMIIYYALGFVAMLLCGSLDMNSLNRMSPVIYVIGLLLLIYVLVAGMTINKASGWISLPFGFSFQPAEVFKLILVIMLSSYLAKKLKQPSLFFWKDIVPFTAISLIPFILVVVQPDLGNAMAFVFIFICLIWVGNMKGSQFIIMISISVALLLLSIQLYTNNHTSIENYFKLHEKKHWVERIDTFLYPEKASANITYHIDHAIIAIGSGRITGDGYLQGNSVHQDYVPYVYSDSIFVVIAEEFGFVGSSVVLLLYMLLIHRIVLISIQAPDGFSRFLAIGIASIFLFQIFQNIGMHVRLMPMTGITLPFISYGGTSLITNMIAIGIVQSIKARSSS